MGVKIKTNSFTKTINPKLGLEFDTDTERIAFVDYLDKLDFNGSDWVAVRGVVDIVRIQATPVPADPVSAVAGAVEETAKLINNVIGVIQSGKNTRDRITRINNETASLEPIVDKLFGTYPFIRDFYQGRRNQILGEIDRARGKNKNPGYEQLNSLIKSVVASVQPVSPQLQRIQFSNDTPVAVNDFSKEFAEYFEKNPTPEMLEARRKQEQQQQTQSQGNANADTSKGFSLPIIIGGIFIASQFLIQKGKKGTTKNKK